MTSPYGEAVEPGKAPEAISRAVASLPPEQMFELMKQMKLCIQNNPTEARNMLLQNPQLAYALLQAQVVMRIVDPKVAMAMLHRQDNQVTIVTHSCVLVFMSILASGVDLSILDALLLIRPFLILRQLDSAYSAECPTIDGATSFFDQQRKTT